jgi:hypothetical protein
MYPRAVRVLVLIILVTIMILAVRLPEPGTASSPAVAGAAAGTTPENLAATTAISPEQAVEIAEQTTGPVAVRWLTMTTRSGRAAYEIRAGGPSGAPTYVDSSNGTIVP